MARKRAILACFHSKIDINTLSLAAKLILYVFTMDHFNHQVFAAIHQIPHGKVATYGDIAKLAGFPSHARQVGKVLSSLPKDTKLPWHRVINSKGEISLKGDNYDRQASKLRAENIEITEAGKIRLRDYRWQGETS